MSEYKNYRDEDLLIPIQTRGIRRVRPDTRDFLTRNPDERFLVSNGYQGDWRWATAIYEKGIRALSKGVFFDNYTNSRIGLSYPVCVYGDFSSFAKELWEGAVTSNSENSLWVNGSVSDEVRHALDSTNANVTWVNSEDGSLQDFRELSRRYLAVVPSEPQETFQQRVNYFLQGNTDVVIFDEKVDQKTVEETLEGKEGFLPAMLREQDDNLVFVYRGQRGSESGHQN